MKTDFIRKKLLILGGIKQECDIVEHAIGVYTIVSGCDTDSPACRLEVWN